MEIFFRLCDFLLSLPLSQGSPLSPASLSLSTVAVERAKTNMGFHLLSLPAIFQLCGNRHATFGGLESLLHKKGQLYLLFLVTREWTEVTNIQCQHCVQYSLGPYKYQFPSLRQFPTVSLGTGWVPAKSFSKWLPGSNHLMFGIPLFITNSLILLKHCFLLYHAPDYQSPVIPYCLQEKNAYCIPLLPRYSFL